MKKPTLKRIGCQKPKRKFMKQNLLKRLFGKGPAIVYDDGTTKIIINLINKHQSLYCLLAAALLKYNFWLDFANKNWKKL